MVDVRGDVLRPPHCKPISEGLDVCVWGGGGLEFSNQ